MHLNLAEADCIMFSHLRLEGNRKFQGIFIPSLRWQSQKNKQTRAASFLFTATQGKSAQLP